MTINKSYANNHFYQEREYLKDKFKAVKMLLEINNRYVQNERIRYYDALENCKNAEEEFQITDSLYIERIYDLEQVYLNSILIYILTQFEYIIKETLKKVHIYMSKTYIQRRFKENPIIENTVYKILACMKRDIYFDEEQLLKIITEIRRIRNAYTHSNGYSYDLEPSTISFINNHETTIKLIQQPSGRNDIYLEKDFLYYVCHIIEDFFFIFTESINKFIKETHK